MSETEKKLLTVNEYAAENHVSRQSVNSKINRHKDELKGHVFIINGRKMLDGYAQNFLKPTKDNALLISKNAELEKSLENEKNVSKQNKSLANSQGNKVVISGTDLYPLSRSVSPSCSRIFEGARLSAHLIRSASASNTDTSAKLRLYILQSRLNACLSSPTGISFAKVEPNNTMPFLTAKSFSLQYSSASLSYILEITGSFAETLALLSMPVDLPEPMLPAKLFLTTFSILISSFYSVTGVNLIPVDVLSRCLFLK